MLLLTISALFMTFLTGTASTNIRRALRREGDSTLIQVEHLLRNSRSVVCNTSTTMTIVPIDEAAVASYALAIAGGKVTLTPAASTTLNLTSTSVRTESGSSFACVTAGTKQYVDINLVLRKLDTLGAPVGNTETFTSSVQVRN